MNGASLDELVLVTGLAPLLETNLRADASLSGAGGCVTSSTREAWLALYEFA